MTEVSKCQRDEVLLGCWWLDKDLPPSQLWEAWKRQELRLVDEGGNKGVCVGSHSGIR